MFPNPPECGMSRTPYYYYQSNGKYPRLFYEWEYSRQDGTGRYCFDTFGGKLKTGRDGTVK